jgi:phospholipid/cholesterol/gamma-HCH transport system ATP-binding protein
LIELRGVRKAFGRPVLRGVNLHVPACCLYGLVGPGASGKTVLLKVIAVLVRPDCGVVEVDGVNLAVLNELELGEFRKRFGMQFQNNALFDFLTVADNIAFPLRRLLDLSPDKVARRVAERLERVALPGFEDRLPNWLSGGQKRRVGIARATVTQASIVLYDEPAAGLDPVTSQKIFDLLRAEQRASGATVVMVSSDLDRLLPVTDRVGMMYQGRLIFDGTTEQARTSVNPHVRQFIHGLTQGPL